MEAIYARRSIRRYRPDPIPRALIESLLDAALWSPSTHNRQPWRFAVVETAERRLGLARAMNAQLRRDLEADGLAPEAVEADVSRSYRRLTGAPVLVVLCLSMVDMDSYPDERRARHEWVMAVQSVAMAGGNFLLAAHEAGLAACWMCAPLFVPDVVRAELDLPDDWEAQALLTVGYADEARTKTRKPLEASVLWR